MFDHLTIEQFLQEITKTTFPSPKGGSAAALAGAAAAALVIMSAKVAMKRAPKNEQSIEVLKELEQRTNAIKQDFTALIEQDALAYYEVITAYKLPPESTTKLSTLSKKYLLATLTLTQIAQLSKQLLQQIEKLGSQCPTSCRGDLDTAQSLVRASLDSAISGIKSNKIKITAPEDQLVLNNRLTELGLES